MVLWGDALEWETCGDEKAACGQAAWHVAQNTGQEITYRHVIV